MVPEQAEFPSVQSVPRLLVKSWCCPYSAEADSLAGGWRIDGEIDNERLLRASSSRVFTESRDLMLGLCAPVSAMYMSDLSSGRLRWLWRLRQETEEKLQLTGLLSLDPGSSSLAAGANPGGEHWLERIDYLTPNLAFSV